LARTADTRRSLRADCARFRSAGRLRGHWARRLWCDLVASHQLPKRVQSLVNDLPARRVDVADNCQAPVHRYRANAGQIQILPVKKVSALAGRDNLDMLARFGQRVEQHACRSRVKRRFRLLDSDQRNPAFEGGWLEQGSEDPGGTDRAVGHARGLEHYLPASHASIGVQEDGGVSAFIRRPGERLADPGAVWLCGTKDGSDIGVQSLLVPAMFSRQGPDDIGQVFSAAAKKRTRGSGMRDAGMLWQVAGGCRGVQG